MKKLIPFFIPLVFALCLCGCDKDAVSIAVIGGADGPTSIFVSSNVNWLPVCVFAGIIVAVVLMILFVCRNKKKK